MKIAINIILAVIVSVLTVHIISNILSNIEKLQVDIIKERELSENAYKLIPRNYGDDTIIIKSQKAQVVYEVDELFGDTTYYYIFISNNKAVEIIKGEKYRLQE